MSYNRPKLSPCASWNPNAITFADSSTLVQTSTGLFVNTNNTIYATAFNLHSVLVWPEGSAAPTRSIFSDLNTTFSIFVTANGDTYADNGENHKRVQKCVNNGGNSTVALYTNGKCGGLFVDIYDNLYCSLTNYHTITKTYAGSNANVSLSVAGSGTCGLTQDRLCNPHGIFVAIDLSLYVADHDNDRIQLFRSGQMNATTVIGNGTTTTITLYHPTSVVLDADGYVFISDQENHRIIGSGPNGFRCIVACSGTYGGAANQLYYPFALGFDTHGNLYVTDSTNSRIQKFILARNSCGKSLQSLYAVVRVPHS